MTAPLTPIFLEMDARQLLDERVTSVVCSDEHGLCLGTQGKIDGAKTAGFFHSIARRASSLSPEAEAPIVLIETETRDVLVKDYDNFTITVVQKREGAVPARSDF